MKLKRAPRSGSCSQRIMSSLVEQQTQSISNTLKKTQERSESAELDAPHSDSGVPSHSNSPDANSGISGFSGGESSGGEHQTSTEMELPSIGGERDPADTPSPLFGSEIGGSLKEADDTICPYCHKTFRQPRLLFCLHALCEDCIIALLEGHDGRTSQATTEGGGELLEQRMSPEQKPPPGVIRCPVCKQDSSVGNDARFAHSMLLDYVTINLLDASTIDEAEIACESCKTKENATARCQQCANFLCANCESAHKYMKCFDGHEVVMLTEIKRAQETGDGVYIHRPISCQSHPNEALKFYCSNCMVPVCNECVMAVHCPPSHTTQKVDSLTQRLKEHLGNRIVNGKEKVQFCQSAACKVENQAEELKNSVEMAREKIDEAFQEFKDQLEARRLEMLEELESLHGQHETHLSATANNYERTAQKISDACKFTERLLNYANTMELLMSEQAVSQQFNQLQFSVPKGEPQAKVDFTYSKEGFAQAIKSGCGSFQSGLLGPTSSSVQIEELTKCIAGDPQTPSTWQSPPQVLRPEARFSLASGRLSADSVSTGWNSAGPLNLGQPCMPRMTEMTAPGGDSRQPMAGYPPSYLPPGYQTQHNAMRGYQQQAQPQSGIMGQAQHTDQRSAYPPPMAYSNPYQQQQQAAAALYQQQMVMGRMAAANVGGYSGNVSGGQMNQGLAGLPQGLANNLLNLARLGSGVGEQSGASNAMQTPSMMYQQQQNAMMMPQKSVSAQSMMHSQQQYGAPINRNSRSTSPESRSVSVQPTSVLPPSASPSAPIANSLQSSLGQPPSYSFNAISSSNQSILSGRNSANALVNGGVGLGLGTSIMGPPRSGVTPDQEVVGQLAQSFSGTVLSTENGAMGTRMSASRPGSSTSMTKSMEVRTRFGSLGQGNQQFNSPHGFCLGFEDEIIVADTNNHRIQVFNKEGEFVFQFGVPGKEEGQLWYPRKVAVTRTNDARYIVCDRGNERSRMQIFSKNGGFVKKIAIRYIDIVAGLSVDSNGMIVAVDSVSPTVFRIDERGELNKWFDCSDYMKEPSDIVVSGREYYICDFKGHCVCVFSDEGKFLRRIGSEKLTNFPNGIDISGDGDVLVGDSHGNKFHVSIFKKNGEFQSEYDCPSVKVSRCCGLRITSEGHIITLAKNNHHVLVLDTIYLQ